MGLCGYHENFQDVVNLIFHSCGSQKYFQDIVNLVLACMGTVCCMKI